MTVSGEEKKEKGWHPYSTWIPTSRWLSTVCRFYCFSSLAFAVVPVGNRTFLGQRCTLDKRSDHNIFFLSLQRLENDHCHIGLGLAFLEQFLALGDGILNQRLVHIDLFWFDGSRCWFGWSSRSCCRWCSWLCCYWRCLGC